MPTEHPHTLQDTINIASERTGKECIEIIETMLRAGMIEVSPDLRLVPTAKSIEAGLAKPV